MSQTAIGVVGTDNYTPLYQPDGRWAMWSIHEIYRGQDALNKYVPKKDDYVIEPETGKLYRVSSLSPVTFIPDLEPVSYHTETRVDQILAVSDANHRLYIDRSVSPYTLSVDGFLRIHTSSASFARIYQGLFIDPTKIISRRYNNSGSFIGHDIPLEKVAFNSQDNYAIKSVPTCNTQAEIPDGETCTVVFFDSSGKVLARATCVTEDTTFVAQAYAEQKYITEIFLKSAFIHETSSSDILFPVNLPTASFNPIGVVQFNDGSQVEYPVDGDKFTLYGLDQFVSTIIGHKVPLTLKYRMASNEAGLATTTVNGHEITRPYQLQVSSPNTSYNVKLYCYPVWVDDLAGYRLKTFLTNLDRNVILEISDHVGLSANSPAFAPTAYGVTQRLTLTVDLANVSGIFNHFLHVQTVDIILRGPASDSSLTNIWESANQVPTAVGYYGTNLRAYTDPATRKKLSIHSNIPTVTEFLNKVYKTSQPLYNPVTETSAPVPTHIEVRAGSESVVIEVNAYKDQVQFTQEISQLSNVELVFLRQTFSGMLNLAVCAMTVR